MNYYYTVECAWCDTFIAARPTTDEGMSGRVSHGICNKCVGDFFTSEFPASEAKPILEKYKRNMELGDDLSVEDEADLYAAVAELEIEDHGKA